MSIRWKYVLAVAGAGLVALVLAILAPARHLTADVVPGRYGAAALACGGGFDLASVEWIDARVREDGAPYWAHPAPGGLVSTFGPGPAVAGALAFLDIANGDALDDATLRSRERTAAAIWIAVSTALLTLALLRRRAPIVAAGAACIASLSFAGAATLGQGLWQQTVALPWLVGALALLAWRDRMPRFALGAPACLAVAVLVRPPLGVLATGLGVAWLLEHRRPRDLAIAAGVAIVAAAPLLAWNVAFLETLLPTGQADANARFGEVFVLSRAQLGGGLFGLLLSPARGIVWFAPIVVIAVARNVRRVPRREQVIALAIVAHVIAMSLFARWWGGVGYGPRLLAEPAWIGVWLAFGSATELPVRRAGRALLAIAVGVTIVVGQLGLWCWRAEQWETRRQPDISPTVLWDVIDSPIPATLRSVDDQLLALDAPGAPARVVCDGGTLRGRAP